MLILSVSLETNGESSYRDSLHVSTQCRLVWPSCKVVCITDKKDLLVQEGTQVEHVTSAKAMLESISRIVRVYSTTHDVLFTLSAHGYTRGRQQYLLVRGTCATDSDVGAAIFGGANAACTVLCLLDTCHSGTLIDLEWTSSDCRHFLQQSRHTATDAIGVVISACADNEVDQDSFSRKYGWGGGLTSEFVDFLNQATGMIDVIDFFRVVSSVFAQAGAGAQHPQISFTWDARKDLATAP